MKEVVIVTSGENEYKIGTVLSAKISELGEYQCAVWEENKDYNANKVTMSSDNHIIYIGPVQDAKALYETGSITWKYKTERMRYGWLGTRAVIIVDPKFDFYKLGKNLETGALGFAFGGPIGAAFALGAKRLIGRRTKTTELTDKRGSLQCYKTLIEKFLAEDLNKFMGD